MINYYYNVHIFYTGYTWYNGYCLYYSTESKTWPAAKSDCAARGNGRLVSITSGAMNSIVSANRRTLSLTYWLGGKCSNCGSGVSVGRTWLWEDGQPWSYTNWNAGENIGGNEACVNMLQVEGLWYDVLCDISNLFICQVQPNNVCQSGTCHIKN